MLNIMKNAAKEIGGTVARTAVIYATAEFAKCYAIGSGVNHIVMVTGRAMLDCGTEVKNKLEIATRDSYWRRVEEL